MRNRVLLLALLPALAALGAGCANLPKASADFTTIEKEIRTVTVMPPAFTLDKVGAITSETVSEMTYDIECEIKAAAETLVTKSRYQLAPLDASDATLSRDPDMREMLFNQTTEIGEAAKKISSSKGKTIDIDYKANIDYFADRTNSDYFLFMRGGGWFKTGGARTLDYAAAVLFGGGPGAGSETRLEAFLVDATRGKVIWYNLVAKQDRDPRKPSNLFNTCYDLMVPILGKLKTKANSSRDHAIIDKYKEKAAEQK